jgi:hypothetical protein
MHRTKASPAAPNWKSFFGFVAQTAFKKKQNDLIYEPTPQYQPKRTLGSTHGTPAASPYFGAAL